MPSKIGAASASVGSARSGRNKPSTVGFTIRSVATLPGQTQLTRTPCRPFSSASTRARAMTPALAAQ